MASILRTSKFIRHFMSLARNIVISNRQEVDVSLLQRSQNLVGAFPSHFSSTCYLQTNSVLERTVRRLNEDARRTGRISIKEIEEALHEIRHSRKATAAQSLMVLRCCGNLVPEETPERRTQLVEEIWKTLENLGISLDISHYNALLKVYLENEHKFSPTKFLAKLEKEGIEPNRVTYQRLISGYCQMGDIAGATKILEYMKEKQLPVSEGVFNALILGHSQADDMESAEGMLSVMKQASLEPSCETYTTLMCGYARRGDKAALERLIKDCKLKDILISDRDFLEVAYSAAVNGHEELVDDILGNIRHMMGYNQEAVNVLLRLVTRGKDETAYKVFLTMQPAVRTDDTAPSMSGHILIKQFIKTKRPVEQIVSLCERLERDGHTKLGLYIAVENSFHLSDSHMQLALLEAFKDKGHEIKTHFFWPALCKAGKSGDVARLNSILKKMIDEFAVMPSFDTLKDYYLPFVKKQSVDETLKGLLEAGVRRGHSVKSMISYLINENKLKPALELALQHSKLSLRPLMVHRMLADALQATGDVKSVVALLHVIALSRPVDRGDAPAEDDEESSAAEDDTPSRFLVAVVSNSYNRVKVADVLREMMGRGLNISGSCAEYVENQLQGNQLTTEISDMLAKLASGELTPSAVKGTSSTVGSVPIARNPVALERIKEKIIANKESEESLLSINRSLFQAYCFDEDLDNALRIKKEWVEELKQELKPGWWAQLLAVYCAKGNLEGTKECLEQIKEFNQDELELDTSKVVKVAKLYIENNQLDEAVNLIKNTKSREEKGSYQTKSACYQAMSAAADTVKDPEQVKRLFQTLVDKDYIEVSNVNLGPIIKAYLFKDDIEGALKEFENCVKLYRATPWKNELATRLIEKEDAVNLQTLVDLSTAVHGEINSLYDLVLSFVECGRIRQARKILETPGLKVRNFRIQSACERYKNEGQVAPLEGLVEATKDLPHIDRSDIYYNLLETYCQADNVDKALSLWTQMQDEDVNVTDQFLIKLGSFLESKGLKAPFEIPKTSTDVTSNEQSKKREQPRRSLLSSSALSNAINAKDVDEALKVKESMEKSGKELSRNELTMLMELLLEKDKLKEATETLLSQKGRVPVIHTLNYFVNRLSLAGELGLMKQVEDIIPEAVQKLTSFKNKYINCAVIAGRASEEIERLEKQIDNAVTTEEVDALAVAFPRGGIFALLKSSPDHLEPVARIVEKYYSKGVLAPANCLCMHYLAEEQFDKARELYQRYNLTNASRVMFQNVLSNARITANPVLVEELISLTKDTPSVTAEAKGLIYSNLITIYTRKGEVETALAKLEEAVKSIPLEYIRTNSLQVLKENLEAKNIPFKYTIPPRQKSKQFSTSSSSSDEQPKQKVAAKH